jgi:hypothetical protein
VATTLARARLSGSKRPTHSLHFGDHLLKELLYAFELLLTLGMLRSCSLMLLLQGIQAEGFAPLQKIGQYALVSMEILFVRGQLLARFRNRLAKLVIRSLELGKIRKRYLVLLVAH